MSYPNGPGGPIQPQPGQPAWGNQPPWQPGPPQAQAQAPKKNVNGPLIGVILVLVLVVAGGGAWALTRGDGGGSDRSSTNLQDALLTQDDVGPEFVLDTSGDSDTDFGDPNVSPACEQALADLGSVEEEEDDPNDAEVSFVVNADMTGVRHTINWIDEGEPTVTEVREALSGCSSFSSHGPDGSMEATWTVGPIEGHGDDAFWINMTVQATGSDGTTSVTLHAWGVFWSRDDVASTLLVNSGVDPQTGESNQPESALAQELASTADQRLAQIL